MVYGIARGLSQATLGRAPALCPALLPGGSGQVADLLGCKAATRPRPRGSPTQLGALVFESLKEQNSESLCSVDPKLFEIKWSTGDKMVYGLPWLDKTAIDLDKTAIGGDKMDEMVYGLPSPR